MKMKNFVSRLTAGIACTALIAGLSLPAMAAEAPQTEPYTISASQWSREDFSQEANPAVFTATYDRALYNAIRQTLVDGSWKRCRNKAPGKALRLWQGRHPRQMFLPMSSPTPSVPGL